MPVQSSFADSLAGCQALEAFLEDGRQLADRSQTDRYVSFAFDSPNVDPLAILQKLECGNQLAFYYENKSEQLAIAAIDHVALFESDQSDRFKAARQFSERCFANLLSWNPFGLSYGKPHLFCGFTFFNRNRQHDRTFPSGTLFLPRWQVTRHDRGTTIVRNVVVRGSTETGTLAQQVWGEIDALMRSQHRVIPAIGSRDRQVDRRNIDRFKATVTDVLEMIDRGDLNKAVLSHAVDLTAPQAFDAVNSLQNLRRRYGDCHLFLIGNRWGQRFIGASPERLFAIRQRRLVADALAGSAPRGTTALDDITHAEELLSSPKEVREHRVVVDFLLDRLRGLGITPEPIKPIRLLQLSNIQHLWTPIYADLTANIHPLQLVERLHPTPAVAGSPQSIAYREIRRHEQFDRLLFAAPIGWFDAEGNASFLVGIRSALLDGCRARLYAGAGIVAGSQPDRELAEIELKLRTTINSLI